MHLTPPLRRHLPRPPRPGGDESLATSHAANGNEIAPFDQPAKVSADLDRRIPATNQQPELHVEAHGELGEVRTAHEQMAIVGKCARSEERRVGKECGWGWWKQE